MKFNIWCFLFDHDDWVMDGAEFLSEEALFHQYINTSRTCRRCGKQLKPII